MFKIYNRSGGFWGEVSTKGEAIEVCMQKGDGYSYKEEKKEEVVEEKVIEVKKRRTRKK